MTNLGANGDHGRVDTRGREVVLAILVGSQQYRTDARVGLRNVGNVSGIIDFVYRPTGYIYIIDE